MDILIEDHNRIDGSALFGRPLGKNSGYCD
jgi:hypothetical protein